MRLARADATQPARALLRQEPVGEHARRVPHAPQRRRRRVRSQREGALHLPGLRHIAPHKERSAP